jgi:hypothetical protein
MNLLNLKAIGAAIALATTNPVRFVVAPRNVCVQGNFTFDSGGATVDAFVQTSIDNGATWVDIAQFHFTTASGRFLFNLNSQTPVTTEQPATDGALAANTAKDGILGNQIRVKYQTTGTYGGASSLSVDMQSDQVG